MRTTADLLRDGYSGAELRRLVQSGDLDHIRRGAYALPHNGPPDPAASHLSLVAATMPLVVTGSVLSHRSAALAHGLPILGQPPDRVDVTRPAHSGRSRGRVHQRVAPLQGDEVVLLDGVPTTSLARTVADLARSETMTSAVISGDAALRKGLDRHELDQVVARQVRWPGVRRARRVAAFVDAGAERPGESYSRVVLASTGLPRPSLQFVVRDEWGRVVGRADFCWEQQRTLGEFDGMVKYGPLLQPGQTPEQVVVAEKRREDAMRSLGWQVVRWTAPDLQNPQQLERWILAGFARSTAHLTHRSDTSRTLQSARGAT